VARPVIILPPTSVTPAPRPPETTPPVITPAATTTKKPTWRPNRDQTIAIASGVVALIALTWLAISRSSPDDDPFLMSNQTIVDTMMMVDSGEVQVGGRLPTGSSVRVDGALVSGRTFRLAPGGHTLTLTAPGYKDATQEVNIRAKQNLVWTPQMIRVTEASGSVETPSRRTTTPARSSTSAPARTTKPPANQRTPYTPQIDSSTPVSVAVTSRADSSKGTALTDITAVSCGSLFARLEWPRALVACEDEAKRGSVVAQRTVGTIYERGLGVNPNAQAAAQWYAKAADGGDAVAQFRYGSMLYSGTGIKKNEKMGITWIRRAADQQQLDAMYALAQALERGDGVKKNESEAVALFTRAAELGYPRAQTKLGSLHAAGDIVVRDDAKAVAWFRKAADQGFAEAQYRLGDMYARGVGVPRSDAEAKRWFTLAAAQGHERAQKALRK
jgi:TPR repeat protein